MPFARSLPMLVFATFALAAPAAAVPVTYEIDPTHTFPSFEADHMGMSVWRGRFDRTRGRVVLDKAAGSGEVSLTIDMASVDFGLDALDREMAKPPYFDTARHPTATYAGRLAGFVDGEPTRVEGALTFRGVTRPVALQIRSFKCMPHPLFKRDWCGADAYATIDRADFGMDAGREWGFSMQVALRIQVEAIAVAADAQDAGPQDPAR
ncbi:MAG TPA: YceI family protein [Xanthomonadaceae bacterium]|jgi:polyisoprenoid-binding protein YceI|nr:YceI family protein [Xanthomonadaceae bacterium]